MMNKGKTVEDYIESAGNWRELLILLREIILTTGLTETVKWGAPVYTFNKKNVVGIGAFKNFVSLWFFNGVFLKDEKKKLINAQEGTTKALRQWRFKELNEIRKDAKLIEQYLLEAIEVEKQGKAIKPERKKEIAIPKELNEKLSDSKKLRDAFMSFSAAKRREFAEYISEAKREETRYKRLDKIIPLILEGKGLYDKYKK